jgi:hypothetical protein
MGSHRPRSSLLLARSGREGGRMRVGRPSTRRRPPGAAPARARGPESPRPGLLACQSRSAHRDRRRSGAESGRGRQARVGWHRSLGRMLISCTREVAGGREMGYLGQATNRSPSDCRRHRRQSRCRGRSSPILRQHLSERAPLGQQDVLFFIVGPGGRCLSCLQRCCGIFG